MKKPPNESCGSETLPKDTQGHARRFGVPNKSLAKHGAAILGSSILGSSILGSKRSKPPNNIGLKSNLYGQRYRHQNKQRYATMIKVSVKAVKQMTNDRSAILYSIKINDAEVLASAYSHKGIPSYRFESVRNAEPFGIENGIDYATSMDLTRKLEIDFFKYNVVMQNDLERKIFLNSNCQTMAQLESLKLGIAEAIKYLFGKWSHFVEYKCKREVVGMTIGERGKVEKYHKTAKTVAEMSS